MTLLQLVQMSDEVTVSSLPHPISMFFLGLFAISTIFLFVEMKNVKKENKLLMERFESKKILLQEIREEFESKVTEISKKIDSRVDKAISKLNQR